MKSSVGTWGNGPKVIRNGNLHHSVTSGENLRSIGRQIHPQRSLIFAKGQNILYWKLGRGCHFSSNGSIYIFNFNFLNIAFSFFFVAVVVFLYIFAMDHHTFKISRSNLVAFMYSSRFSRAESHPALPVPLNALTESQSEVACSDGRATTNSDCQSVLSISTVLPFLPVPSCTNKFIANLL